MISVAMTTYNGEKYIERQLLSILAQTVQADEIIICDDCSKDGTVALIREIIDRVKTDKIKLIVNDENLGYIGNFYKAISLTRGDHIFLADQDDEWHADKLEKMIKAMEQTSAAVICTDSRLIDQDSAPIVDADQYDINPFIKKASDLMTPISFHQLAFGNIAQGCTYCFTKQVKDAYLKVNSSHLIHDHQIMFIAALLGKAYFYKEKLIDYRLHSNNAVGFEKSADKSKTILKKPSKKPYMVQFIDDLSVVLKVPHKLYYKLLYYLRIPYFVSLLRK